MENVNIIWVHWKIRFLGGGDGHKKSQYIGGNCLKRGLRQFADLRDGARKRRGQCTLFRLLALTRLSFPSLNSVN